MSKKKTWGKPNTFKKSKKTNRNNRVKAEFTTDRACQICGTQDYPVCVYEVHDKHSKRTDEISLCIICDEMD